MNCDGWQRGRSLRISQPIVQDNWFLAEYDPNRDLRHEGPDDRRAAIGKVIGCDAFSPYPLEKTAPDFFWYAIHGVKTQAKLKNTHVHR